MVSDRSSSKEIRWKQRFSNFSSALEQLNRAVSLSKSRELTELENQGLIQAFEFTHELAWNVMKDYLTYQGAAELITGSRDATREAFSRGILKNGEVWMEMIQSRNQTSHTYNESVATQIVDKIKFEYHEAFLAFQGKMTGLMKKNA